MERQYTTEWFREQGRLGGEKVKAKYGREHFSEIGKKGKGGKGKGGGRPKKKTVV